MEKIAIVKLGAKGDVIRTLSIAKALKMRNPTTHISWITKSNVAKLLENIGCIDKIFSTPYLEGEEFDTLYNFDIDEEATSLAEKIKAKKKLGFYNDEGFVAAFNLGAEYYINTLFDDNLKKTNKKTYQEMMFNAAELSFNGEHASLVLTKEDIDYARSFSSDNKLQGKLIGIHMGASPRWPSKIWEGGAMSKFIKKARDTGYQVILFGGPSEVESHNKFINELEKENIIIFRNNPLNTDRQFAALVNLCDHMVCSDSFALHVSLALKKRTTGLFFCTSPDEIEGYGLLTKIVSPMLYDFFPERMDEFSKDLVSSITPEQVLETILKEGNE